MNSFSEFLSGLFATNDFTSLSVTLPSLSLPSTLLISTPSSLANFLTFGEAAVFLEKSFTITFFEPASLPISIFFSDDQIPKKFKDTSFEEFYSYSVLKTEEGILINLKKQ